MLRTSFLGLTAALALSACGADADADGGGDRTVVTSFYPLQFVAERVAGEQAEVVSLTPPGAEPHDLELAPTDVASVADADLVVLLEGFQPAVDEAVDQQAPDRHLDVSEAARLEDFGAGDDPHFWLDPLRLADVSDAIADRMAADDPDGTDAYRANADDLRKDLEALDAELSAGLATCESGDLVVSHEAFGYLASRYDLRQVGISGLSPESEPTPATLAEVSDFVSENGVTTIFSEVLVDPVVAETVADETGAEVAVLDPVEGITDDSVGQDYLAVMRANLEALRSGLGCT